MDSPIFDALADRAPIDPLEDVSLSDVAPEKAEHSDEVPPDAAARDAAKREGAGAEDDALSGDEFQFITRGVSDEEKAAVVAVLTQARAEESHRVKRVERREHQPWARSQRVPEGLSEIIADA